MKNNGTPLLFIVLIATLAAAGCSRLKRQHHSIRLAAFSADVTIPLNHRCMGVLPIKSKRIADPLQAHGFVLLGPEPPIVVCAVDWCEIRNGAYDQWRNALARSAGTVRECVLVTSLHQHDAPVVDSGAAALLNEVGLNGELYDERFHARALERVCAALSNSLATALPITHIGLGQARVEQVASSRRVVHPNGSVSFSRGSRSGADPFHRDAPEGQIDPYLKTLSFWDGDRPLLALHAYATHPMSHYGQGEVSSDFVGLARARRQNDDPGVKQIYVSGCSGDVTAGKYNDGSPEMRATLTDRIYRAMAASWNATKRHPLNGVAFRTVQLQLPYSTRPHLSRAALEAGLRSETETVEKRILAAMGLSSRQRWETGQAIDFPCLDFGPAQLLLFPGESFVGYQLMAQALRPDRFIVSAGYGECWPGYIPTAADFEDGFTDSWLWVDPGCEDRIRRALEALLAPNDRPQ